MKLCNETITVFNSRLDENTGMDTYHHTVITGASWYSDIAANVEGDGGLKAANKFTIRIPVDADFSGKAYADPIAYAGGDPNYLFTLKNGDIIVRGAIDEDLRPAELKKICPEVVTILGVTDDRRARAKHWKVVGS